MLTRESCIDSFNELMASTPKQIEARDIAELNLLCAINLPGAEKLDILKCLATLDQWTELVRRYVRDSFSSFQRDPLPPFGS